MKRRYTTARRMLAITIGQNRMTAVSSQFPCTYDANGNLLTDGANTYEYDAWNRLARAKVNNKWFAYEHDALGRRIVEGSNPGNSNLDDRPTDIELYYNASWQVVQEKNVRGDGLGNTYDTTVSNVWSRAYIDALVLRDTTVVVTEGGLGGGGFGGQMIGGGGTGHKGAGQAVGCRSEAFQSGRRPVQRHAKSQPDWDGQHGRCHS